MDSPLATRRIAVLAVAASALWGSSLGLAARVDPVDTRLLTQPAVSASHLAFIYAGDLFVADLAAGEAGNVRRLTTDDGVESNPAFSPDGKTIAFSAQYDGNVDVYTVPVAGGAPTRLTWHPGADTVQGFTPDGKRVLFTSQRATFTARYTQLFTVPIEGGIEDALPVPNAARAPTRRTASVSPTTRWPGVSSSGNSIGAAPPRACGSSPRMAMPSKRSRSRRRAPTTPIRCGWATSSTSARIAPASSTCSRSTRRASRSSS